MSFTKLLSTNLVRERQRKYYRFQQVPAMIILAGIRGGDDADDDDDDAAVVVVAAADDDDDCDDCDDCDDDDDICKTHRYYFCKSTYDMVSILNSSLFQ